MPLPRRRNCVFKRTRANLPAGYRRLHKEARRSLLAELNNVVYQLNTHIDEIAKKYSMTKSWVRTQLFGGGKSRRLVCRQLKTRLYDAYVHFMGKELNKDRAVGNKFSSFEIRAKIRKERINYKRRPREEQELWLAEYKADKEAAAREPRIGRKGEQDAAATLKRVGTDLDALCLRTGVRALVIAVRPDVLFTMDPFIFCDNHIEEFCSIVLNKTPEQLARLLELSTVNGLHSLAPPPKYSAELKKDICVRIQEGLDSVLELRYPNGDAPYVQMNYQSYDYEIIARHRVRLVGWTFNNGRVINPGRLTKAEARGLHHGLTGKTVCWEVIPQAEAVTGEKRKRGSDASEKHSPQKKPCTVATGGAAGDAVAGKGTAKSKSTADTKETVSSPSPTPTPTPSPSPSPSPSDKESD